MARWVPLRPAPTPAGDKPLALLAWEIFDRISRFSFCRALDSVLWIPAFAGMTNWGYDGVAGASRSRVVVVLVVKSWRSESGTWPRANDTCEIGPPECEQSRNRRRFSTQTQNKLYCYRVNKLAFQADTQRRSYGYRVFCNRNFD